MKYAEQEYAQASIKDLRPHPKNPRQGDVGAIHESIEANGFYGAIVAQKGTGYILAGNHRYKAAVQSGAKQVPVIWLDVDEATATRVLLADNRTNDRASYDNAALAEILAELAAGPGLEGTGYDGDDLDALIADLGGSVEPTGFPALTDGDRSEFRQVTFTLHEAQAATVEQAMKAAKSCGPFVATGNENSNGNALARVAEMFLEAHGHGQAN